MNGYDPDITPDAKEWLALDEGERLALVEGYHRDARIALPRTARRLHATIHTVVENQLALNDEPVVRALGRLMKEGLSRHDAIHAIGSVIAEHVNDLLELKDVPDTSRARYYAAIARLTMAEWHKNFG